MPPKKKEKDKRSKRTVLVSGKFEVLHPGHLRLFRFAQELGDRLIVGVLSDRLVAEQEPESHVVPEDLRLEGVRSNSSVDEAIFIDKPIERVIEEIRPDYVVKGKEHENSFNLELEAVKQYGGRLVFSSGEVVFSSLDLIRKNFKDTDQKVARIPKKYLDRHGFQTKDLVNIIQSFSELKICVIGDLIIDEYITCNPLGMSQEEPNIVVTPIDSNRYIGGAGIVAAHAAGLGAKVHYFGVSGEDKISLFAQEKLSDYGVETHLIRDESRPTTLKKRYRAQGQTLLRVSHLHHDSIDHNIQKIMLREIEKTISDCSLLVFSDFNYGCLPQILVDEIIARVSRSDLVMTADSQTSSQTGDISRFKNMGLLTPTEREARIALRNQQDGLAVLLERLRERSKAKNIILKLGSDGVLLYMQDQSNLPQTDRIPALNSSPRDVMGAGDSMLIGTSMALATPDINPWAAACLGSIFAAHQVSQVGNIPLNLNDVLHELEA
jgi:rfaE bifunctional protein kinase chain/domain